MLDPTFSTKDVTGTLRRALRFARRLGRWTDGVIQCTRFDTTVSRECRVIDMIYADDAASERYGFDDSRSPPILAAAIRMWVAY